MGKFQSYVICTSPRSGSTLLCSLLAATGRAGDPDSHFHTPSRAAWLKNYDLKAEAFADERALLTALFDAGRAAGSGDTALFGLRLQRESAPYFFQQLALLHPEVPSDRDRFRTTFGETFFIHLTRGDKLGQAISLIKAMQTGLWHKAPDGTELERLSEPQDPEYDAGKIAHHLAELTGFDKAWMTWFADEGIDPLRVSYEELSADPSAVLARILEGLELDSAIAQAVRPGVAKLSDATSQEWRRRFLAKDVAQQSSDE